MAEPKMPHTPTEIIDSQSGDETSVCSGCGKHIGRTYYPAESDRRARYGKWNSLVWKDGKTPNVRVAILNAECSRVFD